MTKVCDLSAGITSITPGEAWLLRMQRPAAMRVPDVTRPKCEDSEPVLDTAINPASRGCTLVRRGATLPRVRNGAGNQGRTMSAPEIVHCRCCIVGGGPAGMMLGLLLARAGVNVVVLEKHRDFLRDFRGDTVHPSTLEIMNEIGLLDRLLALPHQEARRLTGQFGDRAITFADFSHLPTPCR